MLSTLFNDMNTWRHISHISGDSVDLTLLKLPVYGPRPSCKQRMASINEPSLFPLSFPCFPFSAIPLYTGNIRHSHGQEHACLGSFCHLVLIINSFPLLYSQDQDYHQVIPYSDGAFIIYSYQWISFPTNQLRPSFVIFVVAGVEASVSFPTVITSSPSTRAGLGWLAHAQWDVTRFYTYVCVCIYVFHSGEVC